MFEPSNVLRTMNPRDKTEDGPREPIGGWLLLFSFGMVVNGLLLGYHFFHLWGIYSAPGVWSVLTSPGSPRYHPLWAAVIVCEVAGNLLRLLGILTVMLLLSARRQSMRTWAMALLCFNVGFIWLDHVLSQQIPGVAAHGSTGGTRRLIGTTAVDLLWVMYFWVSERVSDTFTR